MIQSIGTQIGRPDLIRLGARPSPANEPPRLAASVRRLTEEVGFRSIRTIDDGIADTIAWWVGREAQQSI